MIKFFIEVIEDGKAKRKLVQAERVGAKLWYHVNGETRFFEDAVVSRKKSSNDKASGLIAPMPGKITKILKHDGDRVTQNEVVIVMEAMKMEYSLKAPYTGIIEKILVESGSLVSLGANLAQMKKDSDKEAT